MQIWFKRKTKSLEKLYNEVKQGENHSKYLKTLKKLIEIKINEHNDTVEINDIILSMVEISEKKLNNNMEIDGLKIAGLTSGLTKNINKLGKEFIYEVIENKNGLYFSIKDQYKDIISNWVKSKGLC